MAQNRITRATVQALFSVDHTLKPPSPPPPPCDDQRIVAVKQLDSHLAGAPIAVDCQIPAKRKRGRPPRSSGTTAFASPVSNDNVKRSKKEDEEEDVCFICFDGGSLVLCDRRECPKAYHPACVKRDESFFRPNIRWNCGWHLCNICQRNALFMCYTCPYSLCKGCVKHADILCVRGNKGFCRNCMTTIMLIENIPQGNKVQVDFDDTTSWEYLFKVYWVLLKQKELFTSDELIQATNPWKVSGLEHKDDFPKKLHDPCGIKVSELNGSVIHLEANGSKRRKMRKQTLLPNTDIQKLDKADDNKVSCLHGRADWATKELLEFVAHMKNGDTSVLSQFDVQALLLDYIRTNNLRDPRQKCQIICDGRLLNLFGKSHVGHFEMLKLVEYHFKEGCRTNGKIRGASVDPVAGQVEAVGINRDIQIPSRNMKQQAHRCDVKGRASNLDCYAAIDAHNINLVYLKRSLLENLMVDVENFHDKMVGSIVRIRITSNDQKQDMHRLVRIIGTTKATEPYKVGDKTENIMLRILNLNKIEDVTLDGISDQDFSEDECRRLRQSIKLGLVERMTVGEIQEKAMALQTVRVDGWLESEITRLNHLRDRASEMGHRKELRECVEKIELLKTPGERQRRISEIPKVHDDPRMDPCYGSDDDSGESDTEKQDGSVSRYKSNSKVVMESSSPVKVGDTLKHANVKSPKTSAVNGERKRKVIAKFHVGRMEGATRHLRSSQKSGTGRVDVASTSLEEPNIQADSGVGSSDQGAAKIKSMSQSAHSSTANPSSGKVSVSDSTELEKIWRYEDPSGKVQGPFCMLQLRKWNSSGYFPIDLKVWRVNETQLQSVLLSDALRKQLPNELHNGAKSDEKRDGSIEEPNSTTSPHLGCKPNEGSRSNLTSRVDTSDGIEQCKTDHNSDGQFCEYNIRTHPTKRSFMIEERNLDAAVNSTLGMVHMSTTTETSHMTCKTELSVHSSPAARSDNVKMENQPVNNGSLSQDTGAPDSVTVGIMTSNGLDASEVPSSVSKSEPKDLKGLNMEENKHPVTSDVCRDFGASRATGASSMECYDVPGPTTKTGNNDHDIENNRSSGSVEHDSGINSKVCGEADVSLLPLAASMVDNQILKPHDANKHPVTSDVCRDFGASRATGASSMECYDVPGPTTKTGNNDHDIENNRSSGSVEHDSGINSKVCGEVDVSVVPLAASMVDNQILKPHDAENRHFITSNVSQKVSSSSCHIFAPVDENVKTHDAENKHYVGSNVPGQDSGLSWSTMSGEVVFSDLPAASKLENEGLKTSAAGSKHCDAANVARQHSAASWITISGGIEFADLPTTSMKLEDEGMRDRAVENKHHLPSNIPIQNSCISWSTASSLVGEVHLHDVPGEWGAFPFVHAKPSVEGINLVSCSSAKLAEVAGGHPIPTSNSCQLTLCSTDHDDCDSLGWQPIELSTLGDESVSDLLSEVEAMESLRGISPTSRMDCGDVSIDSPRDDCFSPLDGLTLNIDPGKNNDIQFHIHHNHVDQHQVAFSIDINDIPRTTCILSNPSPDVGEGKPAMVSLALHDFFSEAPSPSLLPPPPPPPPLPPPPAPPPPPPPPLTINLEIPPSPVEEGEVDPIHVSVHLPEVAPKKQPPPRNVTMDKASADTGKQGQMFGTTRREPPSQENVKVSSSGSILGNPNLHWSNSTHVILPASVNMHRSTSVRSQGTRASQTSPRYSHGAGRHSVPKDRSHHHHGVDSGFSKSRPTLWSRQSSGGGGGGSSRPAHRGQRVCKFYESGYCKRGAACKYLHP